MVFWLETKLKNVIQRKERKKEEKKLKDEINSEGFKFFKSTSQTLICKLIS